MEQYTLNLLSGLIGTVFGVSITVWMNYVNRKDAAITRMISLVYPIGFTSWWHGEEWKADSIFHEQYSELWGAYTALRSALPCWKRNELDKSWQKFMVMDHYYDKLPEEDISKIFQKGTHKTKDEAVQCSSKFVHYLIQLR